MLFLLGKQVGMVKRIKMFSFRDPGIAMKYTGTRLESGPLYICCLGKGAYGTIILSLPEVLSRSSTLTIIEQKCCMLTNA